MNWIALERLLLRTQAPRVVSAHPDIHLEGLQTRALGLAAALQARGVRRLALHLEDAVDLAVALLGAWRAGVSVLLPADLQPQTRLRWADAVDAWLIAADDLDALDRLFLCPGRRSGYGDSQQADPEPGVTSLTKRHCHLRFPRSDAPGDPRNGCGR